MQKLPGAGEGGGKLGVDRKNVKKREGRLDVKFNTYRGHYFFILFYKLEK